MTDRELIREIHRGQKQYLNIIAEKYYDDVYHFCCYQTGNMQDSYDLAQETFLKFIRYVDNYRYRNLKGYLLTIARNVCIDYFRSHQTRLEKETGFADPEILEKAVLSQQLPSAWKAENEQEEFIITVKQLSEQLPQMQREAIILFYGYGFKYREIAKMTGTGIATVKSRVRQGTKKLKQTVRKEDFC